MKLISLTGAIILMLALNGCAQHAEKLSVKNYSKSDLSKMSVATFAAGCFWHEESLFESIKGVQEATSGYAGGSKENPSYEDVETGTTGHAETVNVYYDSSVVTYPTLLKIYFAGQNPTQVNGQGNDKGTQYRSIVFYRNNTEKQLIENYIKQMEASRKYDAPIAAQVVPFEKMWEAETYHQDYIKLNPSSGYVQNVCIPEIKEVQKEFPELIKKDHVF